MSCVKVKQLLHSLMWKEIAPFTAFGDLVSLQKNKAGSHKRVWLLCSGSANSMLLLNTFIFLLSKTVVHVFMQILLYK